jgi:hypothetical protein
VPAGEQVPVPAEHGLRADQQPDAVQHVAGKAVQQGGEEGPIGGREPDLLAVELAFENRDLMPEGEDLRVLGPVAPEQ